MEDEYSAFFFLSSNLSQDCSFASNSWHGSCSAWSTGSRAFSVYALNKEASEKLELPSFFKNITIHSPAVKKKNPFLLLCQRKQRVSGEGGVGVGTGGLKARSHGNGRDENSPSVRAFISVIVAPCFPKPKHPFPRPLLD